MLRYLGLVTMVGLCSCVTPKRASKPQQFPRLPIKQSLKVAYPELQKCLKRQSIKHADLNLSFAFFESSNRLRVVYTKINHSGYRPLGLCLESQLKRLRLARQDQEKVHRYIFEYQKDSSRFVIRRQIVKRNKR